MEVSACGSAKCALLACVLALTIGCATTPTPPTTEKTLKAWTGKKIADFITEKHYYPESTDLLPNGNSVYRFSIGSGGRVDQWGNVRSHVCRFWIEADPSGTIVSWRYENCG